MQSDSEATIITIKTPYPSDYPFDPSMKKFLTSSLIDFQVQAKTGYYLHKYVQGQMPGTSIQTDGYWETTFNIRETSDWSNTQTLTISSASVSPIPTSSPDPTLIPTPTTYQQLLQRQQLLHSSLMSQLEIKPTLLSLIATLLLLI